MWSVRQELTPCTACCADLTGLSGREQVMIRTVGDFRRAEEAIRRAQ